MRICSNMHRNLYKGMLKIKRKSCKIYPKLVQNPSKIDKLRSLGRFRAFSAPTRTQVGSRSGSGRIRQNLWGAFSPKMSLQGSIFGHHLNPKLLQNRTFEPRSALGPSKNGLWEGVWKKHENLMKNQCENRSFLMAQNHVWRYTLRLFHTFAIFEKRWKIYAKRDAKSHHFWSKNRPWAPQGRLILPFW